MCMTRHSCRSQYASLRVHLLRLAISVGHVQADNSAATRAGPVPHFPLLSDWELQHAGHTLHPAIELSSHRPSLTY